MMCVCRPSDMSRVALLTDPILLIRIFSLGFYFPENKTLDRGGSSISGKRVHMYNVVGVGFAEFITFILNIP